MTDSWDSPYATYITNIDRFIKTYKFDFWDISITFACLRTFSQNI